MSDPTSTGEIIGLDLHAKLFEERGEWLRMGPLRINLRRGSHLEIVSASDASLGYLLDILMLHDSNWLGSLRIHGCPMSGLATHELTSFGIAVFGPRAFQPAATVRSILASCGPFDTSASSLFDERPDERLPVTALTSSLDPASRQWLNLFTLWSAAPSLALIDGRQPILSRNRELAGRVIGALMMRGASIVALAPASSGVEMTPHAPRVHLPVEPLREATRRQPAPSGTTVSWWVA